MVENNKLNFEDLKQVSGGKWSFETLTPEEQDEYLKLDTAYRNSFKFGNNSPEHEEALANFNAFFERMGEKYGEL